MGGTYYKVEKYAQKQRWKYKHSKGADKICLKGAYKQYNWFNEKLFRFKTWNQNYPYQGRDYTEHWNTPELL